EMATGHVARGIGLTTVGVGQEFDVELMRGLAERGAGNFYFLEDATAATEVFAQELDYFVTPLALDVSLTANAGSGYDFGDAVGTRMWNAGTRGGDMRIPAVFLASRTSQTGEPGRRGGGSMIFIQLLPNNFGDGKVADFTLTYRVPGTDELVTQELALVYGGDSTETLETPYLSHPEMAERYAMYNMFLGLRMATQSAGLSCARAALLAVRERAVAWNARREVADPDLAADLQLVELYLANIARTESTSPSDPTALETCGDPYDGYDYVGDEEYQPMGCASVAAPSGLLTLGLVGLAGLVATRRRRRR
ncbi:MAG: hypothetical protein H0T79_17190, partial [Deltaproteobacteria bacterium]|nr:hypothetical protein [Deltaproteobacteria bacterium]